MSLAATIDLLQAQHATISGVRSAPARADYPEAINSASLPQVLTWPEAGQWSQEATGALRRHQRTYLVQVFVKAGMQGRGIGPAIVAMADLIQAFGERYLDPAGFVLASGSPQVTIHTEPGQLSDTGLAILRYAGVEFHGFQFTVRVYEHW